MKLMITQQTYIDLDFEIPMKGKSVLEFDQGMTKMTNATSGKTSLRVPFKIVQVLEGPDSNLDGKLSHFIPIQTGFGEKQIAAVLTLTGLIEPFTKRYPGDVDITSDDFVDFLKAKLLGKTIVASHEVKKDAGGKDRAVITRFEAHVPGSKPVPAAAKGDGGEGDWG